MITLMMMMMTMINARSLLLLGKNKSDFEGVIYYCVQKTMLGQENLELINAKSKREREEKEKWKHYNM